jgi:hypothetical protein
MEDGFGNDHQENTLPGVYLAWTRERALEKTAIFLDTPTSARDADRPAERRRRIIFIPIRPIE